MLHKELPEEIARSLYKHIKEIADIKIYIEGEKRDTNDSNEFIEVRYDGPWIRSFQKDSWGFEYDANILVQTQAEKNIYALEKICGKILLQLVKDIKILKADDTELVCSTLKTDFRQKLQINRFGIIETTVPVLQATVEARHEFTLEV